MVLVSGDQTRLRNFNAIRRTAREKMISLLIDNINADDLGDRAEMLPHGVKYTVVRLPAADQAL